MIFDNIDNSKDLQGLLPKQQSPHIIVTSRFSRWDGSVIELGNFDL